PLEDWGSETYSAPVAIARRCTPATSSADPRASNPRRGWRCFRCSSRRLLWRCALTPSRDNNVTISVARRAHQRAGKAHGALDLDRLCELGGIRTPNLLIRSQMLYPLSYERWVVRFYGRRKQDANAVPGTGVACAEREGFEPSDPVSQVNSLAVSPIRPLSHLS